MTLADLRVAVERLPSGAALTLPRDVLLEALQSFDAPTLAPSTEEPEAWLTAKECADRLQVSQRWCYDHKRELGGKQLSRRCVRFSSRAVARYMGRRS